MVPYSMGPSFGLLRAPIITPLYTTFNIQSSEPFKEGKGPCQGPHGNLLKEFTEDPSLDL